jgi:hypothetical protein
VRENGKGLTYIEKSGVLFLKFMLSDDHLLFILLIMICRHPETSKRPNFSDIMQLFSLPDTKLLKWSEDDKTADPEAATLGADLVAGQDLYKDLQERYIPKESTNNNNLPASNTAKHDSTTTAQQRETTTNVAAKATTPAAPKPNVLPATAVVGAGAHSYEDPSFLTFFEEDINKLQDLAVGTGTSAGAVSDGEKPTGHSYEDPKFVEALSEGNAVTNALSTNA